MKRSAILTEPKFFGRYIGLVEDIDIVEALTKYSKLCQHEDLNVLRKIADKRYADGKWTTKEVIQHITDNERIQAYRALRIARGDNTALPGYDENLIARNARTEHLKIEDIIAEFELTRQSNILMYKSFGEEELQRQGNCSGIDITVLALGFVLVGHQIHHLNVLKERYWNLL